MEKIKKMLKMKIILFISIICIFIITSNVVYAQMSPLMKAMVFHGHKSCNGQTVDLTAYCPDENSTNTTSNENISIESTDEYSEKENVEGKTLISVIGVMFIVLLGIIGLLHYLNNLYNKTKGG